MLETMYNTTTLYKRLKTLRFYRFFFLHSQSLRRHTHFLFTTEIAISMKAESSVYVGLLMRKLMRHCVHYFFRPNNRND